MILSDPSFEILIEENTMHNILKLECSEVMQIIAIIGLFSKFTNSYVYNHYCHCNAKKVVSRLSSDVINFRTSLVC